MIKIKSAMSPYFPVTQMILLFLSIYIHATGEFAFPLHSDYQRPQQEGKQMKLSVPILFLACQSIVWHGKKDA